jgi:hypothetical protein
MNATGYRSILDKLRHNLQMAGISCVCTVICIGCDQWSNGYLRNASRDTITVRLRQPISTCIGDSAGLPLYRERGKWGIVRLGPGRSFQIGHNMGPRFTECIYDSVEASGPGFSLTLSREMIFNLPVEEHGYNYYYLIGWRREDE